jgi:putative phosphoribosyl transferase
MFKDRTDAGAQLLDQLPPLAPENTVVIALPRGGVPVAEVIAAGIGAPLDVAMVRKVGLPGQPELALAAVTDGAAPAFSINRDIARSAGLTDAAIRDLAQPQLDEIERRRRIYRGDRTPVPVVGKTVVVVDDGVATGATMRAALKLLRQMDPERLLVAVPVAASEALADLKQLADGVICLSTPRPFLSVGHSYRTFGQVSDDEVTRILARMAH